MCVHLLFSPSHTDNYLCAVWYRYSAHKISIIIFFSMYILMTYICTIRTCMCVVHMHTVTADLSMHIKSIFLLLYTCTHTVHDVCVHMYVMYYMFSVHTCITRRPGHAHLHQAQFWNLLSTCVQVTCKMDG